jgi:hypothetical protein
MKKIYQFYDKRGVGMRVEAENILQAKKKVKEMGCVHMKFCSIKLKP